MIKSIYFDLDGVLVDSKEIHYNALNKALGIIDTKYIITKEEQSEIFEGLPTNEKLKKLTEMKGLNPGLYNEIWKLKQDFTFKSVEKYTPDQRIIDTLQELKNLNYTIYVSSNCIYSTLKTILLKKGYLPFIDYFISNEDVNEPKPSSEIYLRCLIRNKISPKEALIVEDSDIGKQAAEKSGCNYMMVKNSKAVTVSNIISKIKEIEKYSNKKLNIVIPCAGAGSRFQEAGYTFPKPLIDVNGKPMIQLVVENLNMDANYIYIIQKEHADSFNFKHILNLLTPGCTIIEIDKLTEGAAVTILKSTDYINNTDPLLIVNSDQYLEWNSFDFITRATNDTHADAYISTFRDNQSKWSFVKLNKDNLVCEVAEKNPISNIATTGIYFWKHGQDFIKYTLQMIDKDIRVNNEYYVCPVFNEAILDNKIIKIDYCKKMWGLGTPPDLNTFLAKYKK